MLFNLVFSRPTEYLVVGIALLIICFEITHSDEQEDAEYAGPLGGRVRLIGGKDNQSGRLEVLSDGAWGKACNKAFDYQAATVICRQLGFVGGLFLNDTALFGPSTGQVILVAATCIGSEPCLGHCQLEAYSEEDPSHHACKNPGLGVVVECQNDKDVIKGIRLSGSEKSTSGKVEVFADGRWNIDCRETFTYNASRGACRQMGLLSPVKPMLPSDLNYGPETARFLQDYSNDTDCSKNNATDLICEIDPGVIFFESAFNLVNPDQKHVLKKLIVKSADRFFFEMSGMGGQVSLLPGYDDYQLHLKIVLRKFLSIGMVNGTGWTHFEHSIWFCQGYESDCSMLESKNGSILNYKDWGSYSIFIKGHGLVRAFEFEYNDSLREKSNISIPVSIPYGHFLHVYLGSGNEHEVIYRVPRNEEMNGCYLREDERTEVTPCGNVSTESDESCSKLGCCYDERIKTRCYFPFVQKMVEVKEKFEEMSEVENKFTDERKVTVSPRQLNEGSLDVLSGSSSLWTRNLKISKAKILGFAVILLLDVLLTRENLLLVV